MLKVVSTVMTHGLLCKARSFVSAFRTLLSNGANLVVLG